MKAVFLDYATMGPDLNLESLNSFFSAFETFDETNNDEVVERIRDAEFVFTNKFKMTLPLFEKAKNLRFIGLTATGTDNINLDAARSFGVAVCNIRAYCTQSVVEHVIGVMLMLAHNLGLYDKTVHAGAWQASDSVCLLAHPIPGLADKTLGIVGYGALGHGVAKVASAFGMQVLVSARPGAETIETGRVAFDELLDRADFISLHCPLTDATHGLFGADEFQRMKSTAFVINTARGALIDAEALVEALQSGAIAGAAVDVLAKEPPPDDDPIINYPGDNLIITPHVAWAADAARQNAIDELAANVEAFLNGEERNRVV